MALLLVIGADRVWLDEFVHHAGAAGHRLTVCPSVFHAWALGAALSSFAAIVVDADRWDARANPALRALRCRTRARVVAVHGPPAAPGLHADVLVSKAVGSRTVLQRCACSGSRQAVAGSPG